MPSGPGSSKGTTSRLQQYFRIHFRISPVVMSNTLTRSQSEPVEKSLGSPSGARHEFEKLSTSTEERDFTSSGSQSFRVSRMFSGGGLSCLNLDIDVPDLPDVLGYLTRHPNADQAVRQTVPVLQDVFSSASLRLEVYRDPEGETAPELALYVGTIDDPEVALRKLDEFDERFWIDHIDNFGEHLSVHLEYQ